MGLFDWLFGSGSKPESAPKKQPEPAAIEKVAVTDIQPEHGEGTKAAVADIQPEAVGAAAISDGLDPEIVAAIAASINCVMDASVNAELLAAITAAAVHHGGGVHAVRIKHVRSAWALAGCQKLMDSRQFA